MKYTQSPYTNSKTEYLGVLNLISKIYGSRKKANDVTMAEFECWLFYGCLEDKENGFYSRNAWIWKDETDRITGLCISREGGHDIQIVTHPGHPELPALLLSWIMEDWAKGRKEISTEICDYNAELAEMFLNKGFVKTSDYFGCIRSYDLKNMDLSKLVMPEGYYIKSADEELDLPSRLEVIRNSFNDDIFSEEIYRDIQARETYNKDLDLSVFSPEGKHVCTCLGWIDAKNNAADIESLGTHSSFRKKGLARALMTECFRRLKKKRIETAFIASFEEMTHNFYDSFGYKEKFKRFEYTWERG